MAHAVDKSMSIRLAGVQVITEKLLKGQEKWRAWL